MWLTLGALFLAGASIGALSLLLPHPSEFDDGAIWTNIASPARGRWSASSALAGFPPGRRSWRRWRGPS